MYKLTLIILSAVGLAAAAPRGHAADDILLVCANTPTHAACGKTEHFKVENEAEGKAAFQEMRAKLFDPADPVAQILAYSKWGNPAGFHDLITEAFIYPVDKANCVYAEAERVYYGEESGPIEEGTNENTDRAIVFNLNNVDPRALVFSEQGVFHGADRLILSRSGIDLARVKQGWAQIYAQHCKGR